MIRPVVKENTTLERDMHSKAILNRDETAYERAVSRKRSRQKSKSLIEDLVSRIEALEAEVKTLKYSNTKL
jgi:hypothetical protein